MTKNARYALYGRVSSVKQKDEETIEMQQDALRAFAKGHELTITGEYYDEAQSGTLPFADRVEGRRLLKDAKDGKLDAVLFYRTDRLGRSAFEGLRVCQQFTDMGVAIRSISENYDTSTATGKFMFTMLLAMAENELSTIKKRMNDGKQRKLRRGILSVAGNCPYGYVYEPGGSLIVDTRVTYGNMTRPDIIRMIFDKTANAGLGSRRIAVELNAMGVPGPTRPHWNASAVLNVLRNTKYKGVAMCNQDSKLYGVFEMPVPAIVSPEIWDKAHREKASRKLYNRQRGNVHQYLLGLGIMRCGQCGYAYCGVYYNASARKGNTARFYKCNGHAKRDIIDWGDRAPCAYARPVPADWIEGVVWDECVKILTDRKYADKIVAEFYKEHKQEKPTGPSLEDVEKQIADIKKERQSLIDLRLKNIITDDDLAAKLSSLDADIAKCKKISDKIKEAPVRNPAQEQKITKENFGALKEALKNADDFEIKRDIVHAMVNNIIVRTDPVDKTIRIDVNLNFGADGLGAKIGQLKHVVDRTYESISSFASKISTSCAVSFNQLCTTLTGQGNNSRKKVVVDIKAKKE